MCKLDPVPAMTWEKCMVRANCSFGSYCLQAMVIFASCITPCIAADDFITLDIGGYRFKTRNDISVSGPTRSGTDFRAERAGTPDNDTVARLDGTIRPFERHRIRFMYLDSTREGSASSDRDIAFRNSVIPAGATVNSAFKMRHVELDYLYSFWKSETTEAAFSVGAHWTRLELSLNSPTFNIAEAATAEGPLPMIGIAATTRLGQKWELLGHVYGMSAKIGDFEGDALAYRVGGRYFFTPNIGLGLVWAGINYNFDVNKSSWLGQLDASNRGAEIFLTVRF
jgi:hypothetical protein